MGFSSTKQQPDHNHNIFVKLTLSSDPSCLWRLHHNILQTIAMQQQLRPEQDCRLPSSKSELGVKLNVKDWATFCSLLPPAASWLHRGPLRWLSIVIDDDQLPHEPVAAFHGVLENILTCIHSPSPSSAPPFVLRIVVMKEGALEGNKDTQTWTWRSHACWHEVQMPTSLASYAEFSGILLRFIHPKRNEK